MFYGNFNMNSDLYELGEIVSGTVTISAYTHCGYKPISRRNSFISFVLDISISSYL